jgi:hypothetical protein
VKHPDAHVVAQRTYDTGSGRRRQYRCTPAVGEQHWFSVIITDGSAPAASWAPPPVCAVHPASRVIRFGTYGKTTGKPRQRYRCFPEDGSTVHTFTPPLPREHVHEGHEQCDHCDELRGVHHGETSVARTHSWNTRTVARALEMLAAGESYAATSKWALRVSGMGPGPRRPQDGCRQQGPHHGRCPPASEPPRGHRTVREQVLCAYRD